MDYKTSHLKRNLQKTPYLLFGIWALYSLINSYCNGNPFSNTILAILLLITLLVVYFTKRAWFDYVFSSVLLLTMLGIVAFSNETTVLGVTSNFAVFTFNPPTVVIQPALIMILYIAVNFKRIAEYIAMQLL